MDTQRVWDLVANRGSWSTYCKVGPPIMRAAGSAEGRFIAPAGDVMDDDRRPHRIKMNDDEMMLIERAVVSLSLPDRALVIEVFVKMVPLELASPPGRSRQCPTWRDGFWCFRDELDARSWRNDHYLQIRCASVEAKKLIFARPTLRIQPV
jgi:hypothetical protein